MTAIGIELRRPGGFVQELNTRWHERALWVYMAIVIFHWIEHIAQAYQIWVLEMARPESLGALGLAFPFLVKSELMHFGYAVFMLIGLVVLRHGFVGTERTWWNAALLIQGWHLFEHSLLQLQALLGTNFFGAPVPTSIFQLWVPRPELHLFYNAAVFIPMIVAMWLHTRPRRAPELQCTCATEEVAEPAMA
jgi:hypothetical protein